MRRTPGAAGVLIVNNVAGGVSMARRRRDDHDPGACRCRSPTATAIKAELDAAKSREHAHGAQDRVARDGAVDNTLIAHEWGHYISNRLVANANGLTTQQAQGLGEGFADFHAMLLLVKDERPRAADQRRLRGHLREHGVPDERPGFRPRRRSTTPGTTACDAIRTRAT